MSKPSLRSLVALLAAVLAFAGVGTASAAEGGEAAGDVHVSTRMICYQAHIAGIGWDTNPYYCSGAMTGTIGQGRAIEALKFLTYDMEGLCARAHVSTIGWQPWICAGDHVPFQIGTTGQSLAIEAIEIQTQNGSVAVNAHLSNYGWQGTRSGGRVLVGTTGENRAIEAITIYA